MLIVVSVLLAIFHRLKRRGIAITHFKMPSWIPVNDGGEMTLVMKQKIALEMGSTTLANFKANTAVAHIVCMTKTIDKIVIIFGRVVDSETEVAGFHD